MDTADGSGDGCWEDSARGDEPNYKMTPRMMHTETGRREKGGFEERLSHNGLKISVSSQRCKEGVNSSLLTIPEDIISFV